MNSSLPIAPNVNVPECVHTAICIMAGDFDRQDERWGPLDIFIMALYRVDKFGGGGGVQHGASFSACRTRGVKA